MNLIAIETSAFNQLNEDMEDFFTRFKAVLDLNKEKRMGVWLDNADVCKLLGICMRTLQNLRQRGIIAYTKICNKTYYRAEDVEKTIAYLDVRENT